MKKYFTLLSILMLCVAATLQAQNGGVKGTITDQANDVLIGANVSIKGTTTGTTSDTDGNFTLSPIDNGTYTLLISYIGYEEIEKSVTISGAIVDIGTITLNPSLLFLSNQIVVSGSRRAEKLTETPATIQVISSKQIEELPSFNPGELLSRVKGVEYVRSGVAATGVNIRGFNSNFNAKNLQINDGRYATLIATGLPFGPLGTIIKEDVDRIEVILGPNAALYGPNAHNGLVNTITKDPRSSEGTTFALGAGNQSMVTARLRHAQKINDKWAFKVTGEYTKGEEFEFADSVYIDRLDANGNPGPDGVKEGYEELELDNDFNFMRGSAALYYSLNDDADIIASWGGSNSTYLAPTNVGRNQIVDWKINYYSLKYASTHFFAQAYMTTSKTDDTYAIDERTKQYYRGIDAGLSDAEARGEQSYSSAAKFKDASQRYNAEVQYNNEVGNFSYAVGAQWQRDLANSKGTYLLDTDENDYIQIDQTGVYGQAEYKFGSGFKGTAAFRGDNHEIYGFNFVPKLGIVKTVKDGAFRLTYGQGIAAPTILNMYGNLFGGLILGNSDGFTLADGTKVEKQGVEKIQSYEIGYKGQASKKLFVDANAYYNISEDFLSPVTVVGVTTERGSVPTSQVQAAYGIYGGLVATYVNFGQVNTYGFDLGLNYQLAKHVTMNFNYSYFNYSVDEDNLEENDFNKDGVVNKLDVLVNAPKNKFGIGINYSDGKFFGNIFTRWVEEYDYFSSYQIAAKTQDLTYRGTPVVENSRSTDTYNYGPLGGFVNVDLGLGYHINDTFTMSGQITNLFDAEFREFTASPFIGRLYSVELKINLGKK
ncbi:TonB-dependent receptor [Fulvivirga lutimaris]|uniref:TonB-dependent receptor n=1 Tax=Fulvivirga lutimaris TaxID=1819566 RepID=UPI0012BBEC36|nr:TonB-dependent receptor [Fulvivirga lutimaris]MTI38403.1 TonB-dependent receptor [Fulvivirga lutimaris]